MSTTELGKKLGIAASTVSKAVKKRTADGRKRGSKAVGSVDV
jgi:DNA-binding Lrp family transcriptional regulator